MWAGRYREAAEVWGRWRPSGHRLDGLAVLDGIILAELERTTGLTQQERHPADPESIEQAGGDDRRCVELLRGTDALDPRIWIHLIQGERPPLPRLVLVAQTFQDAALPWAMATVVAFMAEDEPSAVFSYLVASGIDLAGQDAYAAAVEEVADEVLDTLPAVRLRAALYECVASSPAPPTRITVRVMDDTSPG